MEKTIINDWVRWWIRCPKCGKVGPVCLDRTSAWMTWNYMTEPNSTKDVIVEHNKDLKQLNDRLEKLEMQMKQKDETKTVPLPTGITMTVCRKCKYWALRDSMCDNCFSTPSNFKNRC
jgi:phage terminase large subunit GpA-like protein